MYTQEQIAELVSGLSRSLAALWGEAIEKAGLEISVLADDAPDEEVAQKLVEAFSSATKQALELTRLFSKLPDLENDPHWQPAIGQTIASFESLLADLQDGEATSYDRLQNVVDFMGVIDAVPVPLAGSTVGETKVGKLFFQTGVAITAFDMLEAGRTGNYSKVATGITMIGAGLLIEGVVAAGLAALGLAAWPFVVAGAAIAWTVSKFYEDEFEELYQSIFGNEEAAFIVERYARLYGGPFMHFDGINAVAQLGTSGNDVESGQQGRINIIGGGSGDDWLSGAELADVLGGGGDNDRLDGLAGDDQLVGGEGNDQLTGGVGNDSLEGGAGFDSYRFSTDDLADATAGDTIEDSDGLGQVTVDGVNVAGTGIGTDVIHHASLGAWESADSRFRIWVTNKGTLEQSLTLLFKQSGATITVKHWQQGDLGITLPDHPKSYDPISITHPSSDLADYINPSLSTSGLSYIHVDGGIGRDFIVGTNGDQTDVLEGGWGSDIINGNDGKDRINGGDGDDLITGFGDESIVEGGEGDDVIVASQVFSWSIRPGSDVPLDANGIWRDVASYFNWTSADAFMLLDNGQLALGHIFDVFGTFDHSGATSLPGWTYRFWSTSETTYSLQYYSAAEPDGVSTASGTIAYQPTTVQFEKGVSLYGGTGNDNIIGSTASDFIDGGDDNDLLAGDRGNDVIVGGLGDDRIAGGEDNDVIDGGDSADIVYGEEGNDSISGGSGNDFLWGDRYNEDNTTEGGSDIIDGGSGDDQLLGGGGNDYLSGADGVDLVIGGEGNDLLFGGAGADELQGGVGRDGLYGDSGDDKLWGQDGVDYLSGGEGADQLIGGADNDILDGGSDNDTLFGQAGDDTLYGGAGDDGLQGDDGTDMLNGGEGADQLFGNAGQDYLNGDGGNDVLAGGTENDRLSGGAGIDTLYGEDGDDTLDGGAENDKLYAGNGNDSAYGGAGNDLISGQTGNDRLQGGAGNDTIHGGLGDDLIIGDLGNDAFNGAEGSDTYLFEIGWGADVIQACDAANAGIDTIRFGAGVDPTTLLASIDSSNNLVLSMPGTTDTLTLQGYFDVEGAGHNIAFSDGTIWTLGALVDRFATPGQFYYGTAGVDTYLGTAEANTVYGNVGNDVLSGGAGDDIIYAGDEEYSGIATDDDVVNGGAGNDEIYGENGSDLLSGDGGNDWIYGGRGSDVLQGGSGNDELVGGAISYIGGDRWDDVSDDLLEGGAGDDELSGGLGRNFYQFSSGFGHDKLYLSEVGSVQGTTGVVSESAVLNFMGGIAASDVILETVGSDLIVRVGQDDITIIGFNNRQTASIELRFQDGSVLTESQTAILTSRVGGESSDTLSGSVLNDKIFGNGGNDELYGVAGNDLIVGGKGNDRLYGGVGDDIYQYELGDGNDYVYGASADAAGYDRLVLGDGITRDGLSFYRDGTSSSAHLLIMFNATGSYITANMSSDGIVKWIDEIAFADGTTMTANEIAAVATPIDFQLNFGALASGGTVTGNQYSNVFTGNTGVDTFIGGAGDDVYYLTQPGDSDIVVEAASEGIDEVRFVNTGQYYNIVNHTLAENVENMYAPYIDGVRGYVSYSENTYGNNVWYHSTFVGNGLDNVIDASATGPVSVNRIDGGAGKDTMIGRAGADTFVVDDVGDVVIDNSTDRNSIDIIESSVSFSLENTPFVENIVMTGIHGTFATGNRLDNRLDGSKSTGANVLAGGSGNDTYVIGVNDIVIELQDSGMDTVMFSGTYGETFHVGEIANIEQYSIIGTLSSSTLIGSSSSETLLGNAWGNTIRGGAGNDTITGSASSPRYADSDTDYLFGGDGDDLIEGLQGIDELTGGRGNDVLKGGIANNRYYYAAGDGADTIIDSGGIDTILFDSTVSTEDVRVARDGLDLIFTVVTTGGGSIRVQDFWTLDDPQRTKSFGVSYLNAEGHAVTNWYLDEIIGFAEGVNLEGGEASDTLTGGVGSDFIFGNAGDDVLFGGERNDHLEGGDGNDQINGDAGHDILVGGAGDDYLVGGLGDDLMDGGDGRNTYFIGSSSGGDSITLLDVSSSINVIQFGDGISPGDASIDVYGNNDMRIYLHGGSSSVELVGFLSQSSALHEIRFSDGTIWTRESLRQTLLATSMGDDHISAWSLDDIIHGQDGNDTIYGGDGNDHLYGDGGNDHLSGDAGTDTLEGGVGDDTYNVVDAEDQIIEQVSAGVDSVVSDIDYTLTGNVENLQLSEWSDAISAIGNSLANTVRGNYLDNFIDGKSGSDKMYGGDGNDVYSVDSTGDVVYEYSGGGVDAVNSSVTYTLASNVENLTLLGSSSIGGTGNSLDNYLVGNAGGNAIRGLNGNDTLQGMEGADTLTGGAGSDEYLMARTYGVDTAVENDATAGNSDAVRFLTGVSYDQLWFERPSGSNNLEISIIGTADKLIVKDWYLGAQYQTEEIRTIDGNMRLSSANVQLLVTEMAKLAKPAAGQTTLSSTYRTALEPYFAATWSTVEVQGSGAAMPGSNQGLPADSTEIVTSVGPQEGHISQVLHARTAASSGVPSQATAISGQRVARSINQPMPGGASGQTHRDISLAPAVTGGKSLPRRATRQLQARGEHELIRYYGQTERRLPDGAVASELGTLVSAMASFQPHAGHTAVAASVHDQSHQMLFAVPIA